MLLSDGANTRGADPITVAERARKLKIPVYTVALGTQSGYIEHTAKDGTVTREPVPPDTGRCRRSRARRAAASTRPPTRSG